VIKVPIMGEGIRAARVVSLLKQPGDSVGLDEALCEVETDKAVYPIESSMIGRLKEWRCHPDELLPIGADVCVLSVDAGQADSASDDDAAGEKSAATSDAATRRTPQPPAGNLSIQQLQQIPREPAGGASPVPPALSPSITRRLAGVVPTNMQIDARWENIRHAREAAKKSDPSATPSLMLAWCTTQAMKRHGAFRRLVMRDGTIVQRDAFDLGVAVALEEDGLATAVIHDARELDWPKFAAAYAAAIAEVRAGRIEDVQAPLNITSLGGFGIEFATPIVVPPAMSTLFIGKTHERMINDEGVVYPVEVATLSLTFDHRVVNGAGAAAFLHDLREEVEKFGLPKA
jgi:pyruvate/2-oxoglutarate dehydrogenase complex dihydrolipoamide acyltransferase (E2) component